MIPSDFQHRLKQLSDPDAYLREEAVDALVAIGSDELVDTLAVLPRGGEAWKSVARILGKIGSVRAIAVLEEALDNPSNETSQVACLALADAGVAAAPSLTRGLQHHTGAVRSRCAMALGRMRVSEAVESLLPIVTDDDWTVRLEAILALAAMGDDRAVPRLIEALRDEEDAVRQTVPVALGEIGTPAALAGLRTALVHDDETLRWIAEWQLRQLGTT